LDSKDTFFTINFTVQTSKHNKPKKNNFTIKCHKGRGPEKCKESVTYYLNGPFAEYNFCKQFNEYHHSPIKLKEKSLKFQSGNFFFASDSNSKLKISISFWKFLWTIMRATSKFFVFLICICRRQYQKFGITGNA